MNALETTKLKTIRESIPSACYSCASVNTFNTCAKLRAKKICPLEHEQNAQ